MELVVFAAVLVVPIVLVAGGVGFAFYIRDQRRKSWQALARRLGLRYENDQIYGVLHGQQVHVFLEARGSGRNRTVYTVVSSMIVPAFDLGLTIYRHGFFSTVGEWMGMKDIDIGDPAFDQAFVIKGDEPSRVQALLAHGGLRAALADAHRSGARFSVGDDGFRVETTGTASVQWIEWALALGSRMTHAANDARHGVPAASVLQAHRKLWGEYAESVGMVGMSTPLAMSGTMEGAAIFVSASRTGPLRYGLDVRVQFGRPLGMGLVVHPASSATLWHELFGGQDLKLGDQAFDEHFIVKARRTDVLGAVLDAPARAHMLELAKTVGDVRVLDEAVTARVPTFNADPAAVPWLVTQVRALANRIGDNYARVGSANRGPYR
jgi:hypothetical protein